MRHGTSNRRHRNRGNGGRRNNHQRTQVFDSNGPDVRIRGTAHQVCEKYLALAKDASSSGDWIMAENYYQHAEHYQRIINGFEDNSEGDQDRHQEHPQRHQEARREERFANKLSAGSNDDLALPKSILGEKPQAQTSSSSDPVVQKTVSVAD
ncbi:MAG: DUF4167 domain-containing protein [Alphaproteobacteria bacterium]|nr:DUF4167 domain-containing protein [Alphaproteobacteria bacterium]